MIYGIGTDIVEIARIENLWGKFSTRFAEKLLSKEEQQEMTKTIQATAFLAKRFAIKEAFAKAVGTGMRPPVNFNNITVIHDAQGKPYLTFATSLQAFLTKKNIQKIHVSVSDERTTVVAFVVIE